MSQPTEREFLKHVAAHQMTIIRDDGVHRHIRFRRPESSNQHFDLITWPGHLCFCGDMGTYVFQRIDDMFEFFRAHPDRKGLQINLGYWAEKLEAADRRTGGAADEYSPDKFREQVKHWLDDCEASRKVRTEVKDQVLSRADDGEFWAMKAATKFEYEGFRLSDFWEANLRDYTYHFVWCCYALSWGINQYDALQRPGKSATV